MLLIDPVLRDWLSGNPRTPVDWIARTRRDGRFGFVIRCGADDVRVQTVLADGTLCGSFAHDGISWRSFANSRSAVLGIEMEDDPILLPETAIQTMRGTPLHVHLRHPFVTAECGEVIDITVRRHPKPLLKVQTKPRWEKIS